MRLSFMLLPATFVLAGCGISEAQPSPPPEVTIKVEQLAPGVAVLFGQGGNIGVSYGADGNVLIDDQFGRLTEKILAAVKTLDPDPVQFVVNTHWHGDHSGGNENLAKAGAIVLAHDNVRTRMSRETVSKMFNSTIPASPPGALPVVTYAQDVRLHRNGDVIHIFHVPGAHTDGDGIVHWQKANVIHMGDTFFNGLYPFIDLESGGNVKGVLAAVDTVLAMANDGTRIIPGHGPVATKADLAGYRAYLAEVTGKVEAGIAAGKSLAEVQAMKPSAAYDAKYGGQFIKPEQFVAAIYGSLKPAP